MRVALAADGNTRIAMGSPSPQGGYEDAFAFKPGVGGNMRLTAVIYRAAGYAPSANHEIELLLGCRTSSGNRRWIECLLNADGYADILTLDGGPSGFQSIGYRTNQISAPRDNDIMVAELIGNTVSWYLNGVLACSYSGSATSGLGDGAGIAVFYRSGANVRAFGFRSLKIERI